jgi:hypothetical protein
VLAALLVVFMYAVAVSVPSGAGADDGCPSPRAVTDALAARLPGVALPLGQPPGPGVLRLVVTTAPTNTVRLDLTDAGGELLLHRALPPPARVRPADCAALAETVALIVDRYLHEVGYEAPPPPPPPPPPRAAAVVTPLPPAPPPDRQVVYQVGIGATTRAGDAGGLDGAGMIALGIFGQRLGGRLSAGLAPAAYARWTDEHGTLRRIPIRASAHLSLAVGPGRLEPGLGTGIDVLVASFSGLAGDGQHTSLIPSVGLTVAYMLPLARHLYMRALALGGVGVPYRFVNSAGAEVWSTARSYLEVGVESGVLFP